jgi:type I restriction enzyme M protein
MAIHTERTSKNIINNNATLIWNIAELLRGGWKQHEYQDVILPLTLLKRLDSVLSDTKPKVLSTFNQYEGKITDMSMILKDITGAGFYNTSAYDFFKLLDDQRNIAANLRNFIHGFSTNVQQIFEKFEFEKQLSRMEWGNMLYLIIKEFNKINLHPDVVSNLEMWYLFEELIRRFSEQSNETAWEHYTPREVIQLMVNVLFEPDAEILKKEHIIKTVYDPCCGTGGMLSVCKEHILQHINEKASVFVYGQELNPITYAICKADMLIKWEDADRIRWGDKDHTIASTLSTDQFLDLKFDYILANPPYGVDWKKDKESVELEADRGFAGRFGAGLPRSSDGQLLFLQHMISKMRNPSEGGARVGVVFNGSPLFTGDAGGGESEIRRWVCENDYLEAIIALPDQLFYNTGISTYIWILSNRKEAKRKNKIQMIDARNFYKKMRKSLGNKRNEISPEDIRAIQDIYQKFEESEQSKIFKTTDFAYRQITVERPLRVKYDFTTDEQMSKLYAILGIQNIGIHEEELGISMKQEIETDWTALSTLSGKLVAQNKEALETQEKMIALAWELQWKVWMNRDRFEADFDALCKKIIGGVFAKGAKKDIMNNLALRDETADICTDKKWKPEADSELRDTENVPYHEDIYAYFEREVKPFAHDAWIDESKRDVRDGEVGKVGYEFPLTRYFYKYEPPRSLEAIETDIETVENELLELMKRL